MYNGKQHFEMLFKWTKRQNKMINRLHIDDWFEWKKDSTMMKIEVSLTNKEKNVNCKMVILSILCHQTLKYCSRTCTCKFYWKQK